VLHTRAGHSTLSVVLDDIDPYRHVLRPSRPARLTPAALRRWETTLAQAWSLLVTEHPEQARGLSAGLSVLVPLARAERFRPRSASSGDAFGAALLSEPDDAVQLAVTLVHELQHAKLGALMHLFDLYEDDSRKLFYAPWRDDPRPLSALLQGIYAFFGVTRFWRRQRQITTGGRNAVAHFEFALWRRQVAHVLGSVRSAPELTGLGRRFLDGVLVTLSSWQTEPVPGNVAQRAAAAAVDHRAGWRIRHLCPPADAVEALARAWVAGSAPSGPVPPSDMRPDPAARLLDTRSALTRLWLADRDAFRELQRRDEVGRRVSGATAADLAYVSADYRSARQLYLSGLADSPDRPDAWVGLGLTAQAVGHEPVAQVVLTRPELVLAVSRAVAARTGRRPPPWDLADWLGGCPRGQAADAP
uniref:aKG-HExxH-type peptide beta-hydroxylase n=1 Tax=Frankia sp. CIT1 TaxID=2880974 RepID=UPI001EF6F0D9